MLDMLSGLGPFGKINIVIALAVVIISLRCAIELFIKKRKENLERLEIRINST
ncbi:MAG: hypothetical protein JXB48_02570 [Candidatus Latescibacteria bacterium]|nr:hypothetical protein [Candidatus Latescibacterota bacterium]